MAHYRVGCAGWSLPAASAALFPAEGSHLERYASQLTAVEINSSFYRPHRPSTYARWAASTPADFRFSVKVPKEITHTRRLVGVVEPLESFLAEATALEERLGCLLVQLPPRLVFDERIASAFLTTLRLRHDGPVVVEPRHASWFSRAAVDLLHGHRIGRVAADPASVAAAREPGGSPEVVYHRLHGSPRMYYSPYDSSSIAALAARMHAAPPVTSAVWCIFDNTALGAATANALQLLALVDSDTTRRQRLR